MPDRAQESSSAITISWSTIAASAMVVAVASVTGLVILAAVKNVDTLSAIALALAIVAFMTQMVVFIAQTWSTSQLNAETRSFLAELRTRSEGTEQLLSKQVDKLTDDLMARSAAVAKGGQPPARARERIRRDVERALSGTSSPTEEPDPWDTNPYNVANMSEPEKAAKVNRLSSFPTAEEAEPLLAALGRLSPPATQVLARFARDAQEVYGGSGGIPGFPEDLTPGSAVNELFEQQLLEDVSNTASWRAPLASADRQPWLMLTAKGLDVARLLVANGPVPAYLKPRGD